MIYKVNCAVAALFFFSGVYNMTWKNRLSHIFLIPIRERNENFAWVSFFLALCFALMGFFTL